MKEGTYRVNGVKNEKGQRILNMIGNENGEPTKVGDTVSYRKEEEQCECDVCGKMTYWSLTNYYQGFVGTECIKNLNLELVENEEPKEEPEEEIKEEKTNTYLIEFDGGRELVEATNKNEAVETFYEYYSKDEYKITGLFKQLEM